MTLMDVRSLVFVGGLVASACVAEPEGEGSAGEGEPVEETHVVVAECGLELACEPMTLIIEIHPGSAQDCAQALRDADQPGLLSVFHQADGDTIAPYREEAYLLLPGGRALRQQRERQGCSGDGCTDEPWDAWGPHEECTVDDYFWPEPGNITDCETVPDWTCEELAAAAMP